MAEMECPNHDCDAVINHEDDIIKDMTGSTTYYCAVCERELKKKNVALITKYDESEL